MSISDDTAEVPAELKGSPAFNVACLYAQFVRDIREGTRLCADFDDAMHRHRLLDAIEKSNDLGQCVRAND